MFSHLFQDQILFIGLPPNLEQGHLGNNLVKGEKKSQFSGETF